MAGDNRTGRRQNDRNGRNETPERVRNAAGAMNQDTSSGLYRGYVPQNTGGYNPNAAGNPNPQAPYSAGYPGYVPQGNAGTGGMQYTSSMNGGQRGYTSAPPQNRPQPARKKSKAGKAVAVILVLALLAGGCFGLVKAIQNKQASDRIRQTVTAYDNLFCPGVYVDGISLGGMTTEQAWNSVQSRIQQRSDAWQVLLVYQGNVMATINASTLGMSVDPADVMNQAWMQGHTGTIDERYQAMLTLQQTPYTAYTAQPSGDNSVIDQLMAGVKNAVDRPAKDAAMISFNPDDSAEPFTYIDEVYGCSLDVQPLVEKLYRMVSTMESGTVEIVPDTIEPNVKKADLMKHYSHRATATTPIDKHSPDNRNDNIAHAFEFINGYELKPGKTFSFNGIVGERTVKNGFKSAIEYAYGEHVDGIGGGVCQASTTVYQAAVAAGLQILKREPHSDSVSYTDYGKDATVYWVGKRKIDFTFKNNTEDSIFIAAHVEKDPSNKNRKICKVSIYGADLGNVRYELVAEVTDTLFAPSEPKYIKDTKGEYVTYKDQQKSVAKAKDGYIVKSYRLEYIGDILTDRKELFTDRYEPQAEKIYVGVKNRE